MAIPLTPLAGLALRYGAVAAVGYIAGRAIPEGRFPPVIERYMDRAPRGLRLRKSRGQVSGSARVVRDWRIGRLGPKFRIDGTALARITIRRLP